MLSYSDADVSSLIPIRAGKAVVESSLAQNVGLPKRALRKRKPVPAANRTVTPTLETTAVYTSPKNGHGVKEAVNHVVCKTFTHRRPQRLLFLMQITPSPQALFNKRLLGIRGSLR